MNCSWFIGSSLMELKKIAMGAIRMREPFDWLLALIVLTLLRMSSILTSKLFYSYIDFYLR